MTAAAAPVMSASRAGEPAMLFHAEQVCKSFGGVRAVHDMSLRVEKGRAVAVIGPNGAGKSTLLNIMSGIYQPTAGRLWLDGVDLVGLPPHKRVRLGLARTFQKIRLFKQISVLHNVLAGFHTRHQIPAWQYVVHGGAFARDRARCRDEAMRLIAFVGLQDRAAVAAGSLSYGEQRMLELARALATAPRLLLVDEPAAGLNGGEVEVLFDRLAQLRRDGTAIVIVEHNMDLVMKIADRVLVMDYGQRLFEGTPAEVQASPAVVAAYLGAAA